MTAPRRDLVFLKLGGALITKKDERESLRAAVLDRLAREVAAAYAEGRFALVLAHGSGSFAHVAVRDTRFAERTHDRLALARVAAAARRLDTLVVDAMVRAGLPALGLPGSAFARATAGRVFATRTDMIDGMLLHGLVPVVYGDAVLDDACGGAVASTEDLLLALADTVTPHRVVLATDVDGVFDRDPAAEGAVSLSRLGAADWSRLRPALTGSRPGTTDVTGGMSGKVRAMLDLVERLPELQIRVLSGLREGAVASALADRDDAGGTLIVARP